MELLSATQEISLSLWAGNKATRLAELSEAGFNVPPFFVLLASECRNNPADILGACGALEKALRKLGGDSYAVRSSSIEEDSAQNSFAGQFDSFLNVEPADVRAQVRAVLQSNESPHLNTYKSLQGVRQELATPAVIVQKMIAADYAGVAFALDPVTGDRNTITVAAVRGLGNRLVSGAEQGDTWRLDARGKVIKQEVMESAKKSVLSRQQLKKVLRLVLDVSEYVGKPQDIEWAMQGGRLFLLQSRDITATPKWSVGAEQFGLWDNSNIVESYGGVTTPLTFSVARTAYREAYRHYCKVVGVSTAAIKANERAFDEMIGLIRGRVYYNLLNWYRLLMLTPGFKFNSKFMEQMMGVTQGLPEGVLPKHGEQNRFAAIRAYIGMANVSTRMLWHLIWHGRSVVKFHERLNIALQDVPLATKNTEALLAEFDRLQNEVIPHWDTPLLNDMYCMIFHGALRAVTTRWLPADCSDLHNALVSGEAGIISLEPIQLMQKMAALVAVTPGLAKLMQEGKRIDVERAIASSPGLFELYSNYLDRFGDRCVDELKLESATLQEDSLPLLRAIGRMATDSPNRPKGIVNQRKVAEDRLASEFAGRPIKRLVYGWLLGLARARVRDRENMRFERTRVYGRVRQIFLELGERLQSLGAIIACDHIFYLDVAEIRGYIRGNGTVPDIRKLVSLRRSEFRTFNAEASPPRRFITQGPVQLQSSIRIIPSVDASSDENVRKGQPCSAGIVRGPITIVKDPRTARINKGAIIVAERTDPGWVTIFPLVSGLIMERGSLLSHSAIVARELAIPAVVGVDGACDWLRNGDIVELDGATGSIRRVACREEAA